MWVVVAVVAAVVLIATYVTWTAARVDRLHARAAAAYVALDAQSVRRAALAIDVGERAGLVDLQTAAKAVLNAHPDDREAAENDLTHALRATVQADPDLAEANRKLVMARQVHTDLVRDALALRDRPLVRLLGLSRRHQAPRFFDIDSPVVEEQL